MIDMQNATDLTEYIHSEDKETRNRTSMWLTATGLQDVDALTVSRFLMKAAERHIKGEEGIPSDGSILKSSPRESREADLVAARIVRELGDSSFTFSISELKRIHRALFEGTVYRAGEFRRCDISKTERVLGGDTVLYSPSQLIAPSLEYDFSEERKNPFSSSSAPVRHMASFISGIWQIHPFLEGNTRTTAVFMLKWMMSMGIEPHFLPFHGHSSWFRNALVRASWSSSEKGIGRDRKWLEIFLDSVMNGTPHEFIDEDLFI